MDPELRAALEELRQQIEASAAETRRYVDVSAVETRRLEVNLREEILRAQRERSAMIGGKPGT